MSIGSRRKGTDTSENREDWMLSDEELDEAEDYLEEVVVIDTDHDVPYTAGYSKNGKTIYIDRSVPEFMEFRAAGTRMSTVEVSLFKSFAFHELVEKALEDSEYDPPYQLAHQIALRAERAYVESLGAEWDDYNNKTTKLVNKIYKKCRVDNVPDDLDLEPYEDEKDEETLEKIKGD